MSKNQTMRLRLWENFESMIRSARFTRHDRLEVTPAYRDALVMEMILIQEARWDVHCLTPWAPRWVNTLIEVDPADTIGTFDAASQLLLNWTEVSVQLPIGSYDSFKRSLGAEHPRAGDILSPLKDVIGCALGGDTQRYLCAYSCLVFLKKLFFKSDRLEVEAAEAYLSCEDHNRAPRSYTLHEASIMSQWLPFSKRCYEIRPHHGSGKTADCPSRCSLDKYYYLGSDSMIRYFASRHGGLVEDREFQRQSKTVFVPKTYKAYRTISEEPTTLMFYQEGVNDYLVNEVSHHPFLKDVYDPTDQSASQALAKEGSRTGEWCTIDLSSASDTVTKRLVDLWFADTWLYEALICTRSKRTLLPQAAQKIAGTQTLELSKFAPMGSALNFSVEVLVFSAQCLAASLENKVWPCFRVYGDDIVIQTELYDAMKWRLTENGFILNDSKSYRGRGPLRFREACGGHYLNGMDITPIQISRRFRGLKGPYTSWVPAAISLCNDWGKLPWKQAAHSLRGYLISKLLRLPEPLRPVFDDGSRGIATPLNGVKNFHLKSEYSDDLQNDILSFGAVTTHTEPVEDDYVLYEWLRTAEGRRRLWYPEDVIPLPRRETGTSWSGKKASRLGEM